MIKIRYRKKDKDARKHADDPKSGRVFSYDLGVISDIHFPDPASNPEAFLEWLEYNNPRVLIINGDFYDQWYSIGTGVGLSEIHKRVIDKINRKQQDGMILLYTESNHSDSEYLPHVRKAARDIGITIVPGVIVETNDKVAVILHGHQFDSSFICEVLVEHADDEYRFTQQHNPNAAISDKHEVKSALTRLGYNTAFFNAAVKYGANTIITAHQHIPRERILDPTSVTSKGLEDILKNALLDAIIRRGARLAADSVYRKKWEDRNSVLNIPQVSKALQFAIDNPAFLKNFEGKRLKDFWASYSEMPSRTELKKLGPRMHLDDGCVVGHPGEMTYVTMKHGEYKLRYWQNQRWKIGLPDPVPGPEDTARMVEAYDKKYGDLLPQTLEQIEYYQNIARRRLSADERRHCYVLPEPKDMAVVKITHKGKVKLQLPDQPARVIALHPEGIDDSADLAL